MRFLLFILAAATAFGQPAAAPKLTGFPFQDETLRYSIRWPTGLALGEAVFSARKTGSGWSFETSLDASIPGFAIKDSARSATAGDICSTELERSFTRRTKQGAEKTTFDQQKRRGVRVTTLPPNGGKTEFDIPSCPRDAVSFVYFMRREMGQGRVAPADTVFFGSGYSVQLRYTGEVTGKSGIADRVVGSVKGPESNFTVEIDFARDAARTPLSIKVPLAVGTVSAELVR
jgi:hypothetical protein